MYLYVVVYAFNKFESWLLIKLKEILGENYCCQCGGLLIGLSFELLIIFLIDHLLVFSTSSSNLS